MREISQSGSEGGVADNGHPYPYLGGVWVRLSLRKNSGVSPKGFLGRDRSPSGPAPQTLALSKTSPYLGGVWVRLSLRKDPRM